MKIRPRPFHVMQNFIRNFDHFLKHVHTCCIVFLKPWHLGSAVAVAGLDTLEDGRLGQHGTMLEDLEEKVFGFDTLQGIVSQALICIETGFERTDLDFGLFV